jgi:hypothetical protein
MRHVRRPSVLNQDRTGPVRRASFPLDALRGRANYHSVAALIRDTTRSRNRGKRGYGAARCDTAPQPRPDRALDSRRAVRQACRDPRALASQGPYASRWTALPTVAATITAGDFHAQRRACYRRRLRVGIMTSHTGFTRLAVPIPGYVLPMFDNAAEMTFWPNL